LKKVEEIIQTLEAEKQQIENEMAKPDVYGNFETMQQVQQKFESLKSLLEEQNARWEKIVLEMDELEAAE
jgi:ATP-binding cassette subfamily F protein 3